MERVSNLQDGFLQRLLGQVDGFGHYTLGLARTAWVLLWRLPTLCRKLPTLRRFYKAIRSSERLDLPVEGDGLCWAYGMKTKGASIVIAFNRSPLPSQRRIGVASLGVTDDFTMRELLHDREAVVTEGAAEVYLGGSEARVFVSHHKPHQGPTSPLPTSR